ncbi:MAG: peptide chain release factor N(5)-glutamine methyltransferase [Tissierella sp.]|uniref:peptide chain release factor N(5)-glutamine methyltransferase n=1 Tax=Tissierella sp. TaxID=41274 RepID=UPI003F96F7A8
MVIKEILEIGRDRLKDLEYIDPIKESIYIFSKLLGVDKSYIYINLDKWVSKEEEESFFTLIDRRALGEPISYIFEEKEFMGLDLFVEKGVLVPRAETEELVEYILNYIDKNFGDDLVKVLEIGVGTGAISLSIGDKCKNAQVLGIDIGDRPIRVANKNLRRLGLTNVNFRKSDLFTNIKSDKKFSVIVSNPPYIKTDVIDELQVDVKKFEPRLALDGGHDGLLFYRRISQEGKEYLLNGGMLIYEIGFDQGESVKEILEKEGFKNTLVIKDLQGLDRIVLGFKKQGEEYGSFNTAFYNFL